MNHAGFFPRISLSHSWDGQDVHYILKYGEIGQIFRDTQIIKMKRSQLTLCVLR